MFSSIKRCIRYNFRVDANRINLPRIKILQRGKQNSCSMQVHTCTVVIRRYFPSFVFVRAPRKHLSVSLEYANGEKFRRLSRFLGFFKCRSIITASRISWRLRKKAIGRLFYRLITIKHQKRSAIRLLVAAQVKRSNIWNCLNTWKTEPKWLLSFDK